MVLELVLGHEREEVLTKITELGARLGLVRNHKFEEPRFYNVEAEAS